jgi:PKD repeat protein
MPRNRQLLRLVLLARTSKKDTAQAGNPQTRRRGFRRFALLAAVAAAALLVAQVVFAAPPENVNFTVSDPTPNNQVLDRAFSASATDADNDIAAYEWDFDFNGTFTVDATGQNPTHTFPSAGSYSVALRVRDGTVNDTTVDTTGPVVKSVNVTLPNRNPTASFTFTREPPNNGDRPYVGQTIAFSGSGSDPDEDPITYEWNFGDGGTATGPNVTHSYGSRGAKTVTLTVRDDRGGTGTHQETVTVNALPVAGPNILNGAAETGQKHNTPLVGQNFAYIGNGLPALPGQPASPGSSDAEDGTNLTYQWDLDNNGTFERTGQANTGNTAQLPPLPPAGLKTVVLRVIDSRGATNDKSLTFRVNSAPAPGFSVEPSLTPRIGQEVSFLSTSTDPDDLLPGINEQLTYSWSFDLDNNGSFETPGGQTPTQKRTFQTAGTYGVKIAVTDTGGIKRDFSRQILVQNTVPDGTFSFSPDAPLPGQPVTFTGSASSPTGKAIQSMEWDFDFPAATFNAASDTFDVNARGASVSHAFATPGPKVVTLKIQEAGGGFVVLPPKTVNVNAPPRAGFTVAPQEAFVGDGVTLSSTSADPDGPLVRQDWDLDADGQFDDANAQVVSANFANPGLRRLALRVTDSRGATSTATGQVMIRTRPIPPTPLLSGVLVELRAAVYRKFTKVRGLLVRAPKGSKVTVRCLGKGCPKVVTKTSKGSKKLRFKKLQRNFKPGRKLIVTVTKNGFIGKQVVWTIRRRKAPLRQDLCMNPGAKKGSACPSG